MASTAVRAMRLSHRRMFKHFVGLSGSNNRIYISRLLSSLPAPAKEATYPPVQGKYPPGNWDEEMRREDVWSFYNYGQELLELPTVEMRLHHMSKNYDSKLKSFIYRGHNFEHPCRLQFQQNKTKSSMIQGLPHLYDDMNVDEELNIVKPLIQDMLITEYCKLDRGDFDRTKALDRNNYFSSEILSRYILKQMINTMTAALCRRHPHLMSVQVGEDVDIKANWTRYCEILQSQKLAHEDGYGYDEPIKKERISFQGLTKTDFQLRSDLPLPEFVSKDDPLCIEANYPDYNYHPITAGCLRNRDHSPSFLPGCHVGDPSNFGLLGIQNVGQHSFIYHGNKFEKFPEAMRELKHGIALSSLFMWTVAQAHHKGFSKYHDITYPFTGQYVMTDSQTYRFYAYQLNTLSLWMRDELQPLRNLCWYTPEMKLFDGVEDGEVQGFNDDVLKMILKYFILAPRERGYDLTPYLPKPEDPPVPLIADYVEKVIDETVIILDDR